MGAAIFIVIGLFALLPFAVLAPTFYFLTAVIFSKITGIKTKNGIATFLCILSLIPAYILSFYLTVKYIEGI